MIWEDAVDVQIVLILVLSALLAVLAAEVTALRAGRDEWRKALEGVGEALLKAENHAQMLKQAVEDQRNSAARPPPDPRDADTKTEGGAAAHPTDPVMPERDIRDLDADETLPVSPAPPRVGPGRDLEKLSRELYQQWCDRGEPPYTRDGVDIGYLRYAGDQRTSELSLPMHVFSDDLQMGEFVRFSLPGSDSGLAFPNPEAYFNARVHHILFPGLTADYLSNHRQLANTRPVEIQRQGDGLWQKAP